MQVDRLHSLSNVHPCIIDSNIYICFLYFYCCEQFFLMHYKAAYQLLTFYKFVDVDNAPEQVQEHKQFCHDIGLKGRVYIGEEWISSTVTGTQWQLWAYRQYLEQNSYFSDIVDIDIKATDVPGHCFDKMIVKYRKEIVALGKIYDACTIADGGQRISVEDFKKVMDTNDEEYIILDMRNTYEYKLGHFKNAVPAGTINFRELDHYIDEYKKRFEGKKVITYCTGGIRCEKATVMMRDLGIEKVYQLDGGVMKYVNTFNDGNWLGNLYTFDGRVSMMIGDSSTHTVVGKCIYTGEESDNCENCRYSACNARIIAKRKVYKQHLGFCSQECMEKAQQSLLVKNDSFDSVNYKQLRNLVKQGKIEHKAASEKVAKHFAHWLKDTEFNHATSQKEEHVDNNMLCEILQ